jgi:hypothetical protein
MSECIRHLRVACESLKVVLLKYLAVCLEELVFNLGEAVRWDTIDHQTFQLKGAVLCESPFRLVSSHR